MTPPTPKWRERWPQFLEEMEARLQKGHVTYGDESFDRSLIGLIEEIQEELLDLVGWPYVTWCKLEDMREAVREATKVPRPRP